MRWSVVFYIFYQAVFFSTFLCSQPRSLLIRWRVSDISRHSPPHSFLSSLFLSRLPSCPSFERAFVELLMERFRALPCLSEAFSLSFIFPCCSGLPIATSWSQFLTIERFPRATQHIQWRKYLTGMISIITPKWCGDDLRVISMSWGFLSHIIRQLVLFHSFFYRCTYQFDRFELWLSIFDTYCKRD